MRIRDERTWPEDVLEYLNATRDVFFNWERRGQSANAQVSPTHHDEAMAGLRAVLNRHTLHGYHCTRLTPPEIERILTMGMQPPNLEVLRARIRTVQDTAPIPAPLADRLSSVNQASASNRAGMIWFCFYPPHHAFQPGIERFFRSWGGEALYNSHEDDPLTGPLLRQIGVPCLVEADVPMAGLARYCYLDTIVIRNFLFRRGLRTREVRRLEAFSEQPIPVANIRRIIRFPSHNFVRLTRCDAWIPPLSHVDYLPNGTREWAKEQENQGVGGLD